MNQNLENRLGKLEKVLMVDEETRPHIIWMAVHDCTLEGDGKQLPVLGWRHGQAGDIMRLDGETDEALQARTLAASEPYRKEIDIRMFYQITE